ncbi:hypothetical protein AOQ84DRAFT_296949, partial [Glonium stellatum]
LTSAPLSKSSRNTPWCPLLAAWCSGVHQYVSSEEILAPFRSSNCTTASCPFLTASCRAVAPLILS